VSLPEGWVGEHEEECSTIYHPDGVGALQISGYTKDSRVTTEDLEGFAEERVSHGAKPEKEESGDFAGFRIDYDAESETWREWYLGAGNLMLYVTYNCEKSDKGIEDNSIQTILRSLTINE